MAACVPAAAGSTRAEAAWAREVLQMDGATAGFVSPEGLAGASFEIARDAPGTVYESRLASGRGAARGVRRLAASSGTTSAPRGRSSRAAAGDAERHDGVRMAR